MEEALHPEEIFTQTINAVWHLQKK